MSELPGDRHLRASLDADVPLNEAPGPAPAVAPTCGTTKSRRRCERVLPPEGPASRRHTELIRTFLSRFPANRRRSRR